MTNSIWHNDIHPIEMYPREMRTEDVNFQRAMKASHPEKWAPLPVAEPPKGELDILMELRIGKKLGMDHIRELVEDAFGYNRGDYFLAGYGSTLKQAVVYACAMSGHRHQDIVAHFGLASRNTVTTAKRTIKGAYKDRIEALKVEGSL